MIERDIDISVSRQCELLLIHRSGLYYKPVAELEENLLLMRLMDEQYLKTPFLTMRKGFLYLCAVIDLHTRFVVNWGISNAMTAQWRCQLVAEAVELYGKPGIINSDQGSQFTSQEYTELLDQLGIRISMDGKGRAINNIFVERLWKSVKYECVYLNVFEDGVQLYQGLQKYFQFYNTERFHQALKYRTPEEMYLKVA